jgi:hypothetical protein
MPKSLKKKLTKYLQEKICGREQDRRNIMAKSGNLKNENGEIVYPITLASNVYDANGNGIPSVYATKTDLSTVENKIPTIKQINSIPINQYYRQNGYLTVSRYGKLVVVQFRDYKFTSVSGDGTGTIIANGLPDVSQSINDGVAMFLISNTASGQNSLRLAVFQGKIVFWWSYAPNTSVEYNGGVVYYTDEE